MLKTTCILIRELFVVLAIKSLYLSYLLLCALSIKRKRIVFHSVPDASDNCFYMYKEISPALKDYEIVWLFRKPTKELKKKLSTIANKHSLKITVAKKWSIKGILLFVNSEYVFFSHGTYVFVGRSFRGPTLVNLWHGMPIKKIGFSNQGEKPPYCDYIISLSKYYVDVLAQAFGVERHKVLPCGSPRTDVLLNNHDKKFRDFVLQELNVSVHNKIILWLPTYRHSRGGGRRILFDSKNTSFMDELPSSFINDLNEMAVKENISIIIKLHPLDVLNYSCAFNFKFSNIHLITSQVWSSLGVELYDFLRECDALISDISSVIVDCVYANIRIGILGFDKANYQRDLYFDPIENWDLIKITAPYDISVLINSSVGKGSDKNNVLTESYKNGCAKYICHNIMRLNVVSLS